MLLIQRTLLTLFVLACLRVTRVFLSSKTPLLLQSSAKQLHQLFWQDQVLYANAFAQDNLTNHRRHHQQTSSLVAHAAPSTTNSNNDMTETDAFVDGNPMELHNGLTVADINSDVSTDNIPATSEAHVIFILPSRSSDSEALSPFGARSPVGAVSWKDAMEQICNKCTYFSDNKVSGSIYEINGSNNVNKENELYTTDVVIAIGLNKPEDIKFAQNVFKKRRQKAKRNKHLAHFAIACGSNNKDQVNESSPKLKPLVGPYDAAAPQPRSLLPWTKIASGKRHAKQMHDLFARFTSDDYVLAILIFVNQFAQNSKTGEPVVINWVKHSIDATWEKGPVRNAKEVTAMMSKCGDCIAKCVKDENCREGLLKLAAIDMRDQVSSYRTIVSYESDKLRDFSLCILQKHNIFNCDAEIPKLPVVKPLQSFRGQDLDEATARRILVGHLDESIALEGSLRTNTSWLVAYGANVAYDQFPSQNQMFYPASRGKDMWYDPVFRVETLDGRQVWCKRHYKVRPQKVPGTFRLSVLDNGVTSDEAWTIVDVADDLSWAVFHYAGAASAAGLRYLGGLLCTPDGKLPDESQLPRVWSAFQRAGIQPWELYKVDNDNSSPEAMAAGEAPLDFYRKAVIAQRAKVAAAA